MLSVALLGATGYMGTALCAGLLQAFRDKQLNLIILHAPGSDPDKYPVEPEKRILDLDNSADALRESLKDFHFVM